MKKLMFLVLILLINTSEISSAANGKNNVLKIEFSNQSDTVMGAFFTLAHSGDFVNPTVIFSYEDKGGYESPKNKRTFITTSAGVFLLHPDNPVNPSVYELIKYEKGAGQQNSRVIQRLPYTTTNDIIIIANPDGSVSIAPRG